MIGISSNWRSLLDLNSMGERVYLSAGEIIERAWTLYRPNGDVRSTLVFLKEGGWIVGYEHPNEASWVARDDGFAFVSRDGKVTSLSSEISRNDSGLLEIRMSHPDMRNRLAHVLVEVKTPPAESAGDPALGSARPVRAVRKGKSNYNINVCVPDAALRFLDAKLARVFFIANNKSISPGVFESWNLGSDDIVVQYNLPAFFAALRGYACHKLHVMYPNGRSCWGFTDDAQPEIDYTSQELRSLTFATAHWVPTSLLPYFKSLAGRAGNMALVPDLHLGQYSYPEGKAPSAGFISIGFFRFLNWIRVWQEKPPLELSLIGFTGRYAPGKAWAGHDFSFEQKVYETWLEMRRLDIQGVAMARLPEPE
jgi:hypothetical protein